MPTRALRTAASGMYAQQINIQVVANNISNLNTNSFKKNRAEFEDLMYQEVAANPLDSDLPGATEKTTKIQVGNGVQLSSTQKLFTQGDLQQTGNMLDLGLQGDGFYQIRKSDGSLVYSRDGSFKVSSEGTIVNSSGYTLEPGLKITGDTSSVQVGKDGTVSMTEVNGTTTEIGKIELVKFVNPAGLSSLGSNLYAETQASGQPIIGTPGSNGYAEVEQGFSEASNVDIVEEMVAMITAQRAYEVNSKTVKTVEDMMEMANNLKR
jgi:flagellar basal-body rod protein FlgG